MTETKTTNKQYAESQEFISACEQLNIKATKRQASKFRNRRGQLYVLTSGNLKKNS